jgi:hypothetical protein
MSSVWMHFQEAGWIGFLLIPVALFALLLGAVALLGGLIAKKSRAFSFVAAASIGLSGVGLLLGGFGAWYGRTRVDEALSGASIDFAEMEEIWTIGYEEARAAPMIALVLLALPLVVGLLAAAASWLRSHDAQGRRPLADIVIVGVMALFAAGGLILSALGIRDGSEAAKAHALEEFRSVTAGVLSKTSCDPCPMLASAIKARGADAIDQDVPGATDRARKCIDDWLGRIESKKSSKRPCESRDARPDPFGEAVEEPVEVPEKMKEYVKEDDGPLTDREKALRDAAEFGMLGLLGGGKDAKSELTELLASPLLIDDAQRKRAQALLEKVDAPPAKSDSDSGSPGARTGNPVVAGRLPPEVIRRIVRQNNSRFRLCYEQGLKNSPGLQGRISVRFVIGRDGKVATVSATDDLANPSVRECVVNVFRTLRFPQPEGGIVTVSYPLVFSPG